MTDQPRYFGGPLDGQPVILKGELTPHYIELKDHPSGRYVAEPGGYRWVEGP